MKDCGGGNLSTFIFLFCFFTILRTCSSDYEEHAAAAETTTGASAPATDVNKVSELGGLYPGPYFDTDRNAENITAIAGSNAYLPCYVKQLGNKSISWIRLRDAHILTVDRYTFIADTRFQVLPLGDSWTLQIKFVQPTDESFYECQISTAPKLAFRTHLHVLKPTIRINAAEENIFVWEGSRVELRCVVQFHQPTFHSRVKWLRNFDEELKDDVPYKDIVLGNRIEGTSVITTATLPYVRLQNAGNYSCSMENVGSATVTLHVLTGENPAAMYHGHGIMSSMSGSAAYSLGGYTWGHEKRDMFIIILVIISSLLQGIFCAS